MASVRAASAAGRQAGKGMAERMVGNIDELDRSGDRPDLSSGLPMQTVDLDGGHLGVTLSDHPLGVRVDAAHAPDSVAQAGLREGDVIFAVDGERVHHHATACDLLGSNADKAVVLGAPTGHSVTYITAADAERRCSERDVTTQSRDAEPAGILARLGITSLPMQGVMIAAILLLPTQLKMIALAALVFLNFRRSE